jgi:serine/threonine-protein kinase
LAAAQVAVPAGVVHRDVTPKNVLVSRDGQVKLTDFGVARAFDREGWTVKGRVKGKLAYLSPEQLAGGRLDVQSDLFAVGIVLHELATGVHPFRRESRTATLHAIADGSCHLALSRDTPLGAAVVGLLSAKRSGRPPSARVAAEQLEAIADVRIATRVLAHAAQARGPGIARCGRARLSSGIRFRAGDGDPTLEARTLGIAR